MLVASVHGSQDTASITKTIHWTPQTEFHVLLEGRVRHVRMYAWLFVEGAGSQRCEPIESATNGLHTGSIFSYKQLHAYLYTAGIPVLAY